MAENRKLIQKLLDAKNKEMIISGEIVIDPATGKTLPQLVAEKGAGHTDEEINVLIEARVKDLRDSWNVFVSGESEDDGEINTLPDIVAAINANKDAITALSDGGNPEFVDGSIDITDDAQTAPTWTGRVRMIVADYTPPAAEPETPTE